MKLYGYEVTNITDDTRKVVSGSLYVAIKGENFDGESAAEEMLKRGAAAVLTQTDLHLEKQILVENVRSEFAKTASGFYGNPTCGLRLIAVTGTNGKTTTATLIKAILEGQGYKCGFIGTTGYDVCDPTGKVEPSIFSTPRQDELYRLFAEMRQNGADFCVMEASSQALDQFRIAGETFAVGVFTNLTQDHLDWHKTMENYYQAKKTLFRMCESAVICIDDKYGVRLTEELQKESDIPITTYSINEPSGVYGVNIKTSCSGVSYWLADSAAEKSFPFKFRMPGRFNVANSIAAITVCKNVGVDLEASITTLEEFRGVRGRCEVIYSGKFTVICDYAHTEDALAKILTCIRGFAARRIICVFGAAGERDSAKRPSMGATAAKYADFLVITSDNPRFEEPQKIIDDVVEGIPNDSTPYETFTDRRAAIEFAVNEAESEDVILLAGKGHETEQVIGDEYQPFDEREIVKEIMNKF
ncbi:MAG: UDP-N-acetylmuramoyl-L-alanyl-D-glutamate--2,6-diaminopimelate ligase [Oscillospiraceae bacterium]|nr:UDP-N-acetylmuramoyl-L-alanyl-D-glutamate--2,6-diaminopimelate ligase [Oscillospiraceae bacterium]